MHSGLLLGQRQPSLATVLQDSEIARSMTKSEFRDFPHRFPENFTPRPSRKARGPGQLSVQDTTVRYNELASLSGLATYPRSTQRFQIPTRRASHSRPRRCATGRRSTSRAARQRCSGCAATSHCCGPTPDRELELNESGPTLQACAGLCRGLYTAIARKSEIDEFYRRSR